MIRSLIILCCLVYFTGCGGVDPIRAVGDPTEQRSLELPLSQSILGSGAFSTISGAGNVYTWTTTGAFWATNQILVAPANGLVTEATSTSITIYHNSSLKTRLSGVQVLGIRIGDYVQTNQQIAQTSVNFTGNQFQFAVYLNDQAVCPFSYFSQNAVNSLINNFFGTLAFRDGLLCLI